MTEKQFKNWAGSKAILKKLDLKVNLSYKKYISKIKELVVLMNIARVKSDKMKRIMISIAAIETDFTINRKKGDYRGYFCLSVTNIHEVLFESKFKLSKNKQRIIEYEV